jgi:exodeoxyribonuclease-3
VGREQPLAAVINACAPDLVVLQEATRAAVIDRLAGLTGMAQWRSFGRDSLAYMSRQPVVHAAWHRPRFSHHAFVEVVPAGEGVRVFGLHLSAVHSALTEHRRTFELRSLLRSIAGHQDGFHVLAGDFNTLAPGEVLDVRKLPYRLRPFVWMSGGQIKWRTIQTVLAAGYVDAYRLHHPDERAFTFPTPDPHVRLDYVFTPEQFRDRVVRCDIVTHPAVAQASDHLPVVAELVP